MGGNAVTPGGLYRLRRTDQPLVLPKELHTEPQTLRLVMTESLDSESVQELRNVTIKAWDLRRSEDYGSPHLNEHPVEVTRASLSSDGRTVELHIPNLQPTGAWRFVTTGKPKPSPRIGCHQQYHPSTVMVMDDCVAFRSAKRSQFKIAVHKLQAGSLHYDFISRSTSLRVGMAG